MNDGCDSGCCYNNGVDKNDNDDVGGYYKNVVAAGENANDTNDYFNNDFDGIDMVMIFKRLSTCTWFTLTHSM